MFNLGVRAPKLNLLSGGSVLIKYINKRIIGMIPVLIGVTFIIFSIMYFTPGEPARIILGDLATAEDIAIFNKEHGLDQSFINQYLNYMKNLIFKGDLGTSYVTKQPVLKEILYRFPTTFQLAVMSIIFASIFGVLVGVISAVKPYSIFDTIVTPLSLIGIAAPAFWLGMMLIIFFSVKLKWFPPSGFSTPAHWVLPTVALGFNAAARIMRVTRSSMLEVIRQDYIRTARAKGTNEYVVVLKHALRNAMIPIVTTIGLSFGRQLGGAVLTETIFSIPGLGKLMVDAIKVKNFPLIQGGVLFIAFVMIVVNLLIDILYSFIDPRIKSQYTKAAKRMQAEVES